MAVIGAFSIHQGRYRGVLRTLTLEARADIVPSGLTGDSAPQHLVMIGQAEVGAGWDRTSAEGRAYIAIKLDDPSLSAPIYANLIECGDQHQLIWTRDGKDRGKPG